MGKKEALLDQRMSVKVQGNPNPVIKFNWDGEKSSKSNRLVYLKNQMFKIANSKTTPKNEDFSKEEAAEVVRIVGMNSSMMSRSRSRNEDKSVDYLDNSLNSPQPISSYSSSFKNVRRDELASSHEDSISVERSRSNRQESEILKMGKVIEKKKINILSMASGRFSARNHKRTKSKCNIISKQFLTELVTLRSARGKYNTIDNSNCESSSQSASPQ
jgi:hypothetical protein